MHKNVYCYFMELRHLRYFIAVAKEENVTHDLSTDEMLSHLREGKLDVALTIRPTGKLLRGLRFVELVHYGLCVAASPAHRVGGLQTVTLEELASERLIGFSRRDYPEYHDIIEAIFRSTGRKPEIYEQDSIASLVAEVEAGRGVAIVSDCSKSVLTPNTKVLSLTSQTPPIIVGALLRKGTVRVAVNQFIAAAKLEQDEPGSSASAPLC
jgi:LysR family transcriptional regulator, benzoate and cis,cis-muconate-responsive activator of ben and cat genes